MIEYLNELMNYIFKPFILIFNVAEWQDKLVPVIYVTYVIAAINSFSLTSLYFILSLQINKTKKSSSSALLRNWKVQRPEDFPVVGNLLTVTKH